MSGWFIDDGMTLTKTLAGKDGSMPAGTLTFRPALAKKRTEYNIAIASADAERITRFEESLLKDGKVAINGDPVPEGKFSRLNPNVRSMLLNLILGYSQADEPATAEERLGNSQSG